MRPSSNPCVCYDESPVDSKCYDSQCPQCLRISELEIKIAEARHHLKLLIEQRKQLYTTRNRYHDKLIQNLPTELCSRILEFSLGQQVGSDREYWDDSPMVRTTPWLLSRVSKAWNSIVLSTPQLWSVIGFVLDVETVEVGEVQVRLAEMLQRSGDLPLDLAVRTKYAVSWTREKLREFGPILNILSASSYRWRGLKISSDFLLLLTQRRRSPLQSLTVHGRDYSPHHAPSFKPEGPSSLTSPTQLTLIFNKASLSFRELPIHWNQLTQFSAANYDLSSCLEVLRNSPLLRHLSVSNLGIQDYPVIGGAAVVHSGVQVLDIQTKGGSLNRFFGKLTLPSLEKLAIRSIHRTALRRQFERFLDRSSCRISSLTVHRTENLDKTLEEIASLMPALEEIEISDHGTILKTFLTHLHATAKYAQSSTLTSSNLPAIDFLPNLKKIKMILTSDVSFDRMIEEDKFLDLFPPGKDVTFNPVEGAASCGFAEIAECGLTRRS